MGTIYRAVRRSEEAEVMKLWTSVFGAPEWFFQCNLDAEPHRKLRQTLVAVEGGKIVSAVQYFIRKTRWLDGGIQKLGAIANVATYEHARKQGHSGRLLEISIENMIRDGCTWSMLFTGVNNHYARYGWKTVTTRTREGRVAEELAHDPDWTAVPITPGDEHDWWKPFAEVYDAFNRHRPLSNRRTSRLWDVFILPQISGPETVVYVAWHGDSRHIEGYAVARTDEDRLVLSEVGVLPGSEGAIGALYDVVRALAVHRGVSTIRVQLPFDAALTAKLSRLVETPEICEHGYTMVRSLSAKLPIEEIERAFRAEGAHVWSLDAF